MHSNVFLIKWMVENHEQYVCPKYIANGLILNVSSVFQKDKLGIQKPLMALYSCPMCWTVSMGRYIIP